MEVVHNRTRSAAWSRILDVGCGNGVPIAEALVNAGHRVPGLDSSAAMLDRFRANLPGTPVVRGDARQCPFGDGAFDAAFSWGMLFHHRLVDQAAAFASVSRVLKPGAALSHIGFAGCASRASGAYWSVSVTHRFLRRGHIGMRKLRLESVDLNS